MPQPIAPGQLRTGRQEIREELDAALQSFADRTLFPRLDDIAAELREAVRSDVLEFLRQEAPYAPEARGSTVGCTSTQRTELTPTPCQCGVAEKGSSDRLRRKTFRTHMVVAHEHILTRKSRSSLAPHHSPVTATAIKWGSSSTLDGQMSTFKGIVYHRAYDYLVGTLFCLDAALVGAQAERSSYTRSNDPSDDSEAALTILSLCLCFLVTVEFLFRLLVLRREVMPDWQWILFDLCGVLAQLACEAAKLAADSSSASATLLRIAGAIALLRVLRLARVATFVPRIRLWFRSIIVSVAHMLWMVLILCFFTYALSTCLVHMVREVAASGKEDADLAKHFGSVRSSMLTLFASVTGGLDWHTPMDLLASQVSWFAGCVFAFYVAIALFTFINSINGLFVEAALRNAETSGNSDIFKLARDLFLKADVNCNGVLTWAEFEAQLETEAMRRYLEVLDMDISEAKTIYDLIDNDGSGEVDLDEFLNSCFRLRGSAKAVEFASFLRDFYVLCEHVSHLLILLRAQDKVLERICHAGGSIGTVKPKQKTF